MRWIIILMLLLSSGCAYWPQTLEPQYYDQGIKDVKADIDDVTGARTL